jgi:hypothetical protein
MDHADVKMRMNPGNVSRSSKKKSAALVEDKLFWCCSINEQILDFLNIKDIFISLNVTYRLVIEKNELTE